MRLFAARLEPFHDIGKIAVNETILNKPGKLTATEFKQIFKHPDYAAQILKPVLMPKEIIKYVVEHHERMDGSGYPNGLPGDRISLGARIIAVADAYVAMTSKRTYRDALGTNEAIKRLIGDSGKLFDSDVVNAILKILAH